MSEPFIGEIRMFAGNYAPRNWAFCDGQLLAVSQNDALFSLFGTIYGGDGRTTFGLPDLRGRVPIHAGEGPGLSRRNLGSRGGAENVTLTANNLPPHRHMLQASSDPASEAQPGGNVLAGDIPVDVYHSSPGPLQPMHGAAVASVGGSQAHNNIQPFLCIHFIVSLFGIYPSRQ